MLINIYSCLRLHVTLRYKTQHGVKILKLLASSERKNNKKQQKTMLHNKKPCYISQYIDTMLSYISMLHEVFNNYKYELA